MEKTYKPRPVFEEIRYMFQIPYLQDPYNISI